MPIYDYKCDKCGASHEAVVSISSRDDDRECECGGRATRNRVSVVTVGKPAYQMQAVLANGSHVKGHFGKDALRRAVKGKVR